MSFEENILLSIRREFSKNEKYRLFLKHLDNVETKLREERKRHTELMQSNAALKKEFKAVKEQIKTLELELGEYKATEADKKFVRMKSYKKLDQTKTMWETRFWEIHRQLQELKSTIISPQNDSNETQPTP